MSINDLQMKELQDQLEAEQYFSVSNTLSCKSTVALLVVCRTPVQKVTGLSHAAGKPLASEPPILRR